MKSKVIQPNAANKKWDGNFPALFRVKNDPSKVVMFFSLSEGTVVATERNDWGHDRDWTHCDNSVWEYVPEDEVVCISNGKGEME